MDTENRNIEKKLNQIMNMLNLIHAENTYFLGVIKNMITSDEDRKLLEDYINKCNGTKTLIMSGMYEDDIGITH